MIVVIELLQTRYGVCETNPCAAFQLPVIRQAGAINKANPDAKLEVVLYGQSLDMVLKEKSVVADDVQKLASTKNVSFKVCAVTLKRYNVDVNQLLPGVATVPDGIYEIITKQREGWGYIKVAQ